MRVLIVDDEIDTLSIMEQLLNFSGFTAITASNGQDALTLAEIERPDCVLVDVMMPGIDGITLCKMMRVHPPTRNLPVIFITAYQSRDVERKCHDAGGDLVLPKPVGRSTLVEAIDRARARH
jgi:putative two-component system response regulator